MKIVHFRAVNNSFPLCGAGLSWKVPEIDFEEFLDKNYELNTCLNCRRTTRFLDLLKEHNMKEGKKMRPTKKNALAKKTCNCSCSSAAEKKDPLFIKSYCLNVETNDQGFVVSAYVETLENEHTEEDFKNSSLIVEDDDGIIMFTSTDKKTIASLEKVFIKLNKLTDLLYKKLEELSNLTTDILEGEGL